MNIYPLYLGFVQSYLIETPTGLVLVDAGLPRQEGIILRAIQRRAPLDLKLILITHAHLDHYGSAAALKKLTGAPVAVHPLDAAAMASGETLARGRKPYLTRLVALAHRLYPAEPVIADILLEEGEDLGRYGLPGKIVHTPGHTPGSCCLVLNDRIGFVGDLVSTNRQPHLQRFFADDWDQLRQSYGRLRELKLDRAYPGHGRRSMSGEELAGLIDRELEM